MTNVIPFPIQKKKKQINLVFYVECLKRSCPDISNIEDGIIAMLIPVLDEYAKPFHAYATVRVMDLKKIFSTYSTEKIVDLSQYATIHSISEGFEPQSDLIAGHFKENNSESIRVLH